MAWFRTCGSGCERGSEDLEGSRVGEYLRCCVRPVGARGRGARVRRARLPRVHASALDLRRALGSCDRDCRCRRDPAAPVSTRTVAAIVALVLLAAACTRSAGTGVVPPETASPSPVRTGSRSAAAARQALCDVPNQTPPPEGTAEQRTPPQIAEVERQVSQVRGLAYTSTVPVQALTPTQMAKEVGKAFEQTVPTELYRRRSRAWATIGVIPLGDSIRRNLHAFQTSQVVGF